VTLKILLCGISSCSGQIITASKHIFNHAAASNKFCPPIPDICLVLVPDGLFSFVKVHKKLGNTHLALMHFSWATDLDPKGANSQIKEAIDPAMSRSQAEEDTSTTHPGL
jgi:hypothetical protein